MASRVKYHTLETIYHTGTHALSQDKEAIGKRLHIPRRVLIQKQQQNWFSFSEMFLWQSTPWLLTVLPQEHTKARAPGVSHPHLGLLLHTNTHKTYSPGDASSLKRDTDFNSAISHVASPFMHLLPLQQARISFQTYYTCTTHYLSLSHFVNIHP